MKCKYLLIFLVFFSLLPLIRADTTFYEDFNYFWVTNGTGVTAPSGEGSSYNQFPLGDCSNINGICEDTCSLGSHSIQFYYCPDDKMCCSKNICDLTSEFINKYSMYGYSISDFNKWHEQLLKQGFDFTPRQAAEQINGYSSKCQREYCALIEWLPTPINEYSEKIGRLIQRDNPCRGFYWVLGILAFLIIIIIIIYNQNKKQIKKIKKKVEDALSIEEPKPLPLKKRRN